MTGRSPTRAQRLAAKAPAGPAASGPSPPSAPTRVVLDLLDAGTAVASSLAEDEGAMSLRAMMRRQPFRHQSQLEYYALQPGVKVSH